MHPIPNRPLDQLVGADESDKADRNKMEMREGLRTVRRHQPQGCNREGDEQQRLDEARRLLHGAALAHADGIGAVEKS